MGQSGMKPGFPKLKVTVGTANKRNRPLWRAQPIRQRTQFVYLSHLGLPTERAYCDVIDSPHVSNVYGLRVWFPLRRAPDWFHRYGHG
jgi:hypothetical protein